MTLPNFEYLDLPKLPEELIKEVYFSIEINPNTFHHFGYEKFAFHQGTKKLYEFTRSIFDFDHLVNVLVLRDGFYIHTDVNRNLAYNYIIEPGGPAVATNFHYPEIQKMESYVIKPHRWHRLRVDVKHNVTGIESERIVLSVWTPMVQPLNRAKK